MEDFLSYVNDLLDVYAGPVVQSIIAVLVGVAVYALLCRALNKLSTKGFLDVQLRTFLGKVFKWLLIAIVILLMLGFFGVSVGTLWAALSGALALVALGFVAVWSVLSNVLCSILLIIFPPFRIGDEIDIQEPTASFAIRGKVISINMLYTSLEVKDDKAADGKKTILRVPNNIFFQKYIRCIPGKRTESLQDYMSRQQEEKQ